MPQFPGGITPVRAGLKLAILGAIGSMMGWWGIRLRYASEQLGRELVRPAIEAGILFAVAWNCVEAHN